MNRPEYTAADARTAVESAARHEAAWRTAETRDAEAYRHLSHAIAAWELVTSIAESLRGPLANEMLAHQTEQADELKSFWDAEVGDRDYAFDPDGAVEDGGA